MEAALTRGSSALSAPAAPAAVNGGRVRAAASALQLATLLEVCVQGRQTGSPEGAAAAVALASHAGAKNKQNQCNKIEFLLCRNGTPADPCRVERSGARAMSRLGSLVT